MREKYCDLKQKIVKQKECLRHCYNPKIKEQKFVNEANSVAKVHADLSGLLEQMNIRKLKTQQLQYDASATENDTVYFNKMLELMYATFKDGVRIDDLARATELGATFDNTAIVTPPFQQQILKVKQQIDMLSFEVAKLKSVNEALDTIYAKDQMEMELDEADNAELRNQNNHSY
ncbi:uncharacterized protein LOC131210316 [Anopheles bellator]|uniref:uncharacterized protein LOC131210316 n=1 Tax=Anopheles bellator TaxID=139047 RepID=UPI0026485B1B|nr:uncharacterized protein LOC131210316 [Anopheles bellator]